MKRTTSSTLMGIILALAPSAAGAQGGTDVWVAPFRELGASIEVGMPRNLTERAGYDNQPAFTRAGDAILFTSVRADAQADIWRVLLANGATTRLTATAESEYSATPMPDGKSYSVIRVEHDSTQRLWKLPFAAGDPSLVLNTLRPVGYHVWVGDATIGAFVLGSPNALVLVDPRTEKADTVARNIGRALVRVPGRDAFTYVQAGTRGDTNWIVEMDVRTRVIHNVAPAPERADYHAWTSGGRLVSASDSRLWIWTDGRWDLLRDFSDFGVRGISRLAMSPLGDRLAFVAEDGAAP
ncbi:MAG: TolB family protein [Gemmatimonadaceae bacterium]